MNREQQYILTIQNGDVFKEVDVSGQTPSLKIGTLQDCEVRLKGELFPVPISLALRLGEDGWRLSCGQGLCLSSSSVQDCGEALIGHGDILRLCRQGERQELLTLSFSYNFTAGLGEFDTILDIRGQSRILIGNHPAAQIQLASGYIGEEYLILSAAQNGRYALDVSNAADATLNGVRQLSSCTVGEFDFIGIADYSFYLKNQLLYTQGRKDLTIRGIPSQPLREETAAFCYPKLNRSPRMEYVFDREPIEILNPPGKPSKPRDNLVLQLSPALAMLAVTFLTRSGLIGGSRPSNLSFLLFSVATMTVGIFTTVLSFVHNRRQYKKALAAWYGDYEAYIAAKRLEIQEEQQRELAALEDLSPSGEQLRDFVKTFSSRLFERSPGDGDFLHVRAGLGAVPALRPVTNSCEEHIKEENDLAHIPAELCKEYALIQPAPVILHLRESGCTGVVGSPEEQYEFFKTLLLDVCVQQDYEELQVVVFIPRGQEEKYRWIRWFPHIRESGGGARGIVCDDESRDSLLEYLYALAGARSAAAEQEGGSAPQPSPHVLVLVLEEYGLRTHPLFKFAEQCGSLGLSFVFFQEYGENLPRYCQEIAELQPGSGVLLRKADKAFRSPFRREGVDDASIRFAAERLAPVYSEKIALASRLTAKITLFELLNIIEPKNLDLRQRWARSNVQKSLSAPLGVDAKGSVIALDLHEKAHGPHGLVAGTTGSGKSEIMQSYILSAAVSFHPYEVGFVIIDFKGGGMANQFERLPHLIGKITDIDSQEINRSLLSIRAELEKRKRLFAEHEVNHIDQYIAKYREGAAQVPLPHLILIVDEFAELKAEQPEFMKELISTARVGRSLGIHLILATQKPSGQVNEQIWSNSRFKLCLKVATREDSNEVLRSPLAAEILEPGRAYLQVGNNEVFTLFQSAYSGASASSDKNGSMREFSIQEVDFAGRRTEVYQRRAPRSDDGSRITQLKALVSYINGYCQQEGIPSLPDICLPPLPELLPYPSQPHSVRALPAGVYDAPSSQLQPELTLDLLEANVMIIGSAQTGKTTLLQSLLRGLAEAASPKEVSVYILDFASKIMKVFQELNHVGGVLTDGDDEKLKNFFKMILSGMAERKEVFSQLGVSSYEAYLELAPENPLPHIVIMVDNLAMFRELFPDYEEALLNICREGLALGITVIATAKQTSGLSYRYLNSFARRLAFNCTENSEYSSLFDRCQLRPRSFQGRGLAAVDKVVYEYQAFQPFPGEKESQRTEAIRAFIASMEGIWGSLRARPVPGIPHLLTGDYWAENGLRFDPYVVPIGLTYGEIEPLTVDLAHIGGLGVYGRKGFGKSNLLRILLGYLQRHVFDFPSQVYLIDSYDHQLAEFRTFGIVEQLTIDCGDFEDILQTFADEAERRMDILREGADLAEEPLLLCVLQNQGIYGPGAVPKPVCERLRQLLKDAPQLKLCFLFSDVENNGEYAPPELLKVVRELGQQLLLDDLPGVKFLGSNKFTPAELKQNRKPLSLGDGYWYDARDGVQKLRLVKCEEAI